VKTKPEPYKIKMVEPIRLIPREEREARLTAAHYNIFNLKSDDVFIDLLTDSGTGAMSDNQWAGIMTGDESYAGSRSFYNLEQACREIFGHEYMVPVHQGRGAENVLFSLLIKPGQSVIGNYHFDTTQAHIELKSGYGINLVVQEAFDTGREYDFKGNIDTGRLEEYIENTGVENIAFILLTVTCNSVGGQPVSLENIRQTRVIADRYGLRLFLDAARFAENAWFIKAREKGYNGKAVTEIVREMFSCADGFVMSAKKDGLVNIGGLIGIKSDRELYNRVRARMVPLEGFPTYGGLAGRDLEALARGLKEVVDESYLQARVGQVAFLAAKLKELGVPIQEPAGGHAVFVDAAKFLPHIPPEQFPGQALACELYLEAGVRGVEVGSFMLGRDPETGEQRKSPLEFLRLTIPRRVYTDNHMAYTAEALGNIFRRRDSVSGVRIAEEEAVLRHFTARLEPV
jgi:tryptophanase